MIKRIVSTARALRAFARLVRAPENLDLVFELDDGILDDASLEDVLAPIRATEAGRAALATRPALGRITLDDLADMPRGSVGEAWRAFLVANDLDPNALQTERPDTLGGWVIHHFRETHDLWHVATGFRTDVAGELGLQAFYAAQSPGPLMPMLLAAGFLNTALFSRHEGAVRMQQITRGWLLGRRATSLFGLDWRAWLTRPLADLRAEHGLDLAAVDAILPPVDAEAPFARAA